VRVNSPLSSTSVVEMRLPSSTSSRASKARSTDWRKTEERMMPPASSAIVLHKAAPATRRNARLSEPILNFLNCIFRRGEPVAEATNRLDHVLAELAAQAADKHLNRIGVAVKILIIKMLHQFGARDDAALVVDQIFDETIFERGEFHRRAVHRHA